MISDDVKTPFGSPKNVTPLSQPTIAASGRKNSLLRMFA